jgi:hypothetical protein
LHLFKKKKKKNSGSRGSRRELSVRLHKAPPQRAPHTGSKHRSTWPLVEGGLYRRGRVGRGGKEWEG